MNLCKWRSIASGTVLLFLMVAVPFWLWRVRATSHEVTRVPETSQEEKSEAAALATGAAQKAGVNANELHDPAVPEADAHLVYSIPQKNFILRGSPKVLRTLMDSRYAVPGKVLAYVDQLATPKVHHDAATAFAGQTTPPIAPLVGHIDDRELTHADITPTLLLDVFYATYRDRYPHVLTYRPQVDCQRGRYLMIGVSNAGFGTTTESYFLKILYTLHTNMTGVHVPFPMGHPDEPPHDQDEFWRFYDWEVSQGELDACPLDSPVRRNVLDLVHRSEDVGALQMRDEILSFASSLYWNGVGGSIRLASAGLFGRRDELKRDYFLQHQWLLELRWNCRNHAYGSNVLRPPLMHNDMPYIDMSIHIRRGDIMDGNDVARPEFADRYRPTSFYMDAANRLLQTLNRITPRLPQRLIRITIYSEGNLDSFRTIIQNFTQQGYSTTMNLDTKTSRVFAMLAESDINILSVFSQFSNYYRVHLHRLRAGNDIIGLDPGEIKSVRMAPSSAAGFLFWNYDFHRPGMMIENVSLLWHFMIEWKLRREQHFAACAKLTVACLRSNPYALSPLGAISTDFLLEGSGPTLPRL